MAAWSECECAGKRVLLLLYKDLQFLAYNVHIIGPRALLRELEILKIIRLNAVCEGAPEDREQGGGTRPERGRPRRSGVTATTTAAFDLAGPHGRTTHAIGGVVLVVGVVEGALPQVIDACGGNRGNHTGVMVSWW